MFAIHHLNNTPLPDKVDFDEYGLQIPVIPERLRNKLNYQHGFTKRDRKNIFKLPVKDLNELKGKATPSANISRPMVEQKNNKCCKATRVKNEKEIKTWIYAKFQGIIKRNGKRYKAYKCPNPTCLQWIMVEIKPKTKKEDVK
jgi:hypothetical protein